jgi:hypothetical protein
VESPDVAKVAISTALLELSILFISAAAGSDLLGLEEDFQAIHPFL